MYGQPRQGLSSLSFYTLLTLTYIFTIIFTIFTIIRSNSPQEFCRKTGPALANRRPCFNFPPPFLLPDPFIPFRSSPLHSLATRPRSGPLKTCSYRVWHRWRHSKIFPPRLPFPHLYLFFPSLSPLSLRLELDPSNTVRGLEELCKLLQRGLGRSPSGKRI